MKKLIFLSILGLLTACSKSTVDVPSPNPVPSEVYVFDRIIYTPSGSEDATTLETFPRMGFSLSNGTSVEQTALLNSQEKSTSAFMYGSDLESLFQGQDTAYVRVPVSLGSNGQVVLSNDTWPLTNSYIIRPLEKDPIRIPVKPNTRLSVTGSITEKVLKTPFIVVLKSSNSSHEKQIMGTWIGTIPVSEDLNYHFEEKK